MTGSVGKRAGRAGRKPAASDGEEDGKASDADDQEAEPVDEPIRSKWHLDNVLLDASDRLEIDYFYKKRLNYQFPKVKPGEGREARTKSVCS